MDFPVFTKAFIAVVIISIILVMWLYSRILERVLMKGFWKCDSDFCENADLNMFILYLGKGSNGYLYAENKNGVILNNPIKMHIYGFNVSPWIANRKYFVSIDWQGHEHNEESFPSSLRLAYYPTYSKLVFYKGDSVYAVLYKDTQMSCMDSAGLLMPAAVVSAGQESI